MRPPPIIKVEWCWRCNWEGEGETCPRCDSPTCDLGYRVGWAKSTSSYYSRLESIPLKIREGR
jgi:hypothetical protein